MTRLLSPDAMKIGPPNGFRKADSKFIARLVEVCKQLFELSPWDWLSPWQVCVVIEAVPMNIPGMPLVQSTPGVQVNGKSSAGIMSLIGAEPSIWTCAPVESK